MSARDRLVRREEILDLATYERRRPEIRERLLAVKAPRRIHLGSALTFLFENADTVRYQVQEMLRVERRTAEADVLHELATYNELIGPPGGLGCTLLIEIDDEGERQRLLRAWRDLPQHVFLELEDGRRVPAGFDPRQVGDERLSSVQYLEFDCGGETPVAIACDHPQLRERATLSEEQRAALAADL